MLHENTKAKIEIVGGNFEPIFERDGVPMAALPTYLGGAIEEEDGELAAYDRRGCQLPPELLAMAPESIPNCGLRREPELEPEPEPVQPEDIDLVPEPVLEPEPEPGPELERFHSAREFTDGMSLELTVSAERRLDEAGELDDEGEGSLETPSSGYRTPQSFPSPFPRQIAPRTLEPTTSAVERAHASDVAPPRGRCCG